VSRVLWRQRPGTTKIFRVKEISKVRSDVVTTPILVGLAPHKVERLGISFVPLYLISKATNTKVLLRQKSLLRRLCRVAQVILVQYDVLDALTAKSVVNQFERDLLHALRTRGASDMISMVKTNRNIIMRYILGQPLERVPGTKIQDGWPKRFHYLKFLSTDPKGIRALLTLLTLTRAFSLGGPPNLETITQEWKPSGYITSREFQTAFQLLRIRKGEVRN
jgi:hypothetical protein